MKDSFGRTINYLRISVTDRCNLRCQYCMPQEGIAPKNHQEILRSEEIIEIVNVFSDLGIQKVRLTGGEPLVRKGIVELCQKISAIKGIEDLAMTTNGVLLAPLAKTLKNAGLQRVNISLDTIDPQRYLELSGGGKLEEALNGYHEAKKAGLYPIKINAVLLGGEKATDIVSLVKWAMEEEIEIRFIELMPIGTALRLPSDAFIGCDEVLRQIPQLISAKSTDGVAKLYSFPGKKGKVGLITPVNCRFCLDCNRIRLTADGYLKTCLHSNKEIRLKGLKGKDLQETIIQAVKEKEEMHHGISLISPSKSNRNMYGIGG